MFLGHYHNTRDIHLLSKQLKCIYRSEEDAESILDPPLDERGHLWVAGRGVGPLGDGCLHFLWVSWGSGVGGGSLLYIRLY